MVTYDLNFYKINVSSFILMIKQCWFFICFIVDVMMENDLCTKIDIKFHMYMPQDVLFACITFSIFNDT